MDFNLLQLTMATTSTTKTQRKKQEEKERQWLAQIALQACLNPLILYPLSGRGGVEAATILNTDNRVA